MKLENWVLVAPNSTPYDAPETLRFSIQGEVFGHPKRPDGDKITTSTIIGKGPEPDSIRTYSGSVYVLGEPSPDYEKKFPGGKERFFNALKK